MEWSTFLKIMEENEPGIFIKSEINNGCFSNTINNRVDVLDKCIDFLEDNINNISVNDFLTTLKSNVAGLERELNLQKSIEKKVAKGRSKEEILKSMEKELTIFKSKRYNFFMNMIYVSTFNSAISNYGDFKVNFEMEEYLQSYSHNPFEDVTPDTITNKYFNGVTPNASNLIFIQKHFNEDLFSDFLDEISISEMNKLKKEIDAQLISEGESILDSYDCDESRAIAKLFKNIIDKGIKNTKRIRVTHTAVKQLKITIPNNILYRNDEIHAIINMLQNGINAILISGLGGTGKTTLARCVFQNSKNMDLYDCCDWILYNENVVDSMIESITLSKKQKKDLMGMTTEQEKWNYLEEIFNNNKKNKLFIFDNVTTSNEQIEAGFKQILHWKNTNVIVTTNRNKVKKDLSINGYYCMEIENLGDDSNSQKCKELFWHYYTGNSKQNDAKNDKIVGSLVKLAGYNTLIIELLAKSGSEAYTLNDFYKSLYKKGFSYMEYPISTFHSKDQATGKEQILNLFSINEKTDIEKLIMLLFTSLPEGYYLDVDELKWLGYEPSNINGLVAESWILLNDDKFSIHPVVKQAMQIGKELLSEMNLLNSNITQWRSNLAAFKLFDRNIRTITKRIRRLAILKYLTDDFNGLSMSELEYIAEEANTIGKTDIAITCLKAAYKKLLENENANLISFNINDFVKWKLYPFFAYHLTLQDLLDARFHLNGDFKLNENNIKELSNKHLNIYKRFNNCSEYINISNYEPTIFLSNFFKAYNIGNNNEYRFADENYRNLFCSIYIANVFYLLSTNSWTIENEFVDEVCLDVENISNNILASAEKILEDSYGFNLDNIYRRIKSVSYNGTRKQLVELAILCKLLRANILINNLPKTDPHKAYEYSCFFHDCSEKFKEFYNSLSKSDDLVAKRYASFYTYIVALLSRDYRLKVGVDGQNIVRSITYAEEIISKSKKEGIPKADGYLQLGLAYHSVMNSYLNLYSVPENALNNLENWFKFSVKIRKAVKKYCEENSDEDLQLLFENYLELECNLNKEIIACMKCFNEMLEFAFEKCNISNKSSELKAITELGFVSKALLIFAAIGTSGGALNMLGQMFMQNQNALESDKRIAWFIMNPKYNIENEYKKSYSNANASAYRCYMAVCSIRRGEQSFSHSKVVECILSGKVIINLDGSVSSNDLKPNLNLEYAEDILNKSLQITIKNLPIKGYYWQGIKYEYESALTNELMEKERLLNKARNSFFKTNVMNIDYSDDSDFNKRYELMGTLKILEYSNLNSFLLNDFSLGDIVSWCNKCLKYQVEELKKNKIILKDQTYIPDKFEVEMNLERFSGILKKFDIKEQDTDVVCLREKLGNNTNTI